MWQQQQQCEVRMLGEVARRHVHPGEAEYSAPAATNGFPETGVRRKSVHANYALEHFPRWQRVQREPRHALAQAQLPGVDTTAAIVKPGKREQPGLRGWGNERALRAAGP